VAVLEAHVTTHASACILSADFLNPAATVLSHSTIGPGEMTPVLAKAPHAGNYYLWLQAQSSASLCEHVTFHVRFDVAQAPDIGSGGLVDQKAGYKVPVQGGMPELSMKQVQCMEAWKDVAMLDKRISRLRKTLKLASGQRAMELRKELQRLIALRDAALRLTAGCP
jgi:hypothetical protein